MLIVDAPQHEELDRMHHEFVAQRRAMAKASFQRAIARGEMRDDIDLDFAADMLAAPLFYRHLVLRQPLTKAYVKKAVDEFVARYCVPSLQDA
jgi:hypothetical protein